MIHVTLAHLLITFFRFLVISSKFWYTLLYVNHVFHAPLLIRHISDMSYNSWPLTMDNCEIKCTKGDFLPDGTRVFQLDTGLKYRFSKRRTFYPIFHSFLIYIYFVLLKEFFYFVYSSGMFFYLVQVSPEHPSHKLAVIWK